MKTAISVPDDIFSKAERIAQNMGIPRSQLFARALQEFIDNHRVDYVTERLNEIYGSDPNQTNATSETGIEAIRDATQNDSW